MGYQTVPLTPGTSAPDFVLPCSAHAKVALRDFRGTRLILAFYPAVWEPVFREQRALYQAYTPTFQDLSAAVVGVSSAGAGNTPGSSTVGSTASCAPWSSWDRSRR